MACLNVFKLGQEDDGFVGPGGATRPNFDMFCIFVRFSVDAFTSNPVLREQLAALTAMLQQHPEMSWTQTVLAI